MKSCCSFLFLLFLLLPKPGISQLDFMTVHSIKIEGNKKTKPHVILRELDFELSDTIPLEDLANRIQRNEQLLMNTGLFTTAKIRYGNWEAANNQVQLLIEVSENWFLYPFPIFELADRNFNVWWETYNRSLKRVNFGLRFYHINFTGRNDLIKLVGQFGFTQKLELDYTLPAINKKRTLGFTTNFLFTRNREIGYATEENKLLFYRNEDDILLKRFRGGLGVLYRPEIEIYHHAFLNYHQNKIHERVPTELNPDFFLEDLKQQYFSLAYEFTLDNRDIKPYPSAGQLLKVTIQKDGFGLFKNLNALSLSTIFKQYYQLGKKSSLEFFLRGKMDLTRARQPYFNSIALGYEFDYIRGYEFYVIDGLDFAFLKTALRFQIFDLQFKWGKLMPIKAFKKMPAKWYLVFNNELGYVNNPFYGAGNSLANELLWGGGIALNLVVYNDKVVKFEYSINRLGEHGFFLHWAFNF